MDETLAEMKEVWESHPDGIIGMTYSLSRDNLEWDKIAAFCRCLGVTKLLQVLKRLVRTPAYRSGLPDVAGTRHFLLYFIFLINFNSLEQQGDERRLLYD